MRNNRGCTTLADVVAHEIIKADWRRFEYFEPHLKELTLSSSFKTECKDNKVARQVKKYAAEEQKKGNLHIDPA